MIINIKYIFCNCFFLILVNSVWFGLSPNRDINMKLDISAGQKKIKLTYFKIELYYLFGFDSIRFSVLTESCSPFVDSRYPIR